MTTLLLILLLLVGLADLVLHFTGNKTISQYYHQLFPQWVDSIILVVLLVLTQVFFGWATFAAVMTGTIFGHMLWHEGG